MPRGTNFIAIKHAPDVELSGEANDDFLARVSGKWANRTVAQVVALLDAVINSDVGVANGVAGLDSNGLVPAAQLPPLALERIVVVADQTERYALTTSEVQNGDLVKQTDTLDTYVVSDDTQLNGSGGYTLITTSGAAPVDSVFGRIGVVAAVAGDYHTGQITNNSSQAGSDLDDVLNALIIGTDVQAWDTLLDSIATLSFSGNGDKILGVNAGATAFEFKTPAASVAWGGITGTLADQTDLQSALDAKAASSHSHAASDITSGTLAIAQGGTNAATAGAARTSLDVYSTTEVDSALSAQTHDASDITSGTLAIARGGTNSGTESGARTNLGLAIGSDVQAYDSVLDDISTDFSKSSGTYVHTGTFQARGSSATSVLFKSSGGGDRLACTTTGVTITVSGGDTFVFEAGGLTLTSGNTIEIGTSLVPAAVVSGNGGKLVAVNSGGTDYELVDNSPDVTAGVSAYGTDSQGGHSLAFVTGQYNYVWEFSSVGATNSETLFTAVAGATVLVVNNGANDLKLYPATGDNIQGNGVNTAVTVTAGEKLILTAYDATNWA